MTAQGVWITGHDREMSTGHNWEITGCYPTREEAVVNGRSGEWVGLLPFGRSPDDETLLPESEWVDDIKAQIAAWDTP